MARPRWKRTAIVAVKVAVAVLVVAAVGRHVAKTWDDLSRHHATLHVEPGWVAVSVVLYLLGLSACGAYFGRVMDAGPTPVRRDAALRAYLISHLGKYVPGKAMVVVLRAALVAPYGARPATAAFATLYETLVMMSAGGLLAAIGFAIPPIQPIALVLGLGLGLAFLVLVDPKVFPRLSALMSMPFPNVGPDALPRFTRPLLGIGLLWTSAGWILLGLSQVAVVRAVSPTGVAVALWPVVIASVALATVGGFAVAVLPGGLGVREWVLMTTMAPALGQDVAVISALALRLTWVLGELIATAVLASLRPPRPVSSVVLEPEPILSDPTPGAAEP